MKLANLWLFFYNPIAVSAEAGGSFHRRLRKVVKLRRQLVHHVLAALPGDFTMLGLPATLLRNAALVTAPGVAEVRGVNATLIYASLETMAQDDEFLLLLEIV